MSKKYCIFLVLFILSSSIVYAGGIELPLTKEGIDTALEDKGTDKLEVDINRLNPPISAEEYKSLQFQEGDLDYLSAEEKTYYITAGDILIVKLPDDEEFQTFEVNFEGYITLPKLGNFKAEGLTIGELEKSIFFSLPLYLRRQDEVQVQIKEKRKYIQVLGYVIEPGWYLLPENAGIQGAFVAAGGLIDGTILNEIELYRTTYTLKSSELKKIPIDMFQFLTTTDYNILPQIKSKDVIVVPMTPRMGTIKRTLSDYSPPQEKLETDTKEKIRIAGAVRNASMVDPIKGSNLFDNLIAAGGTTSNADLEHIFLVKKLKDGNYRTKVVNLLKYIEDKNFQDIPYVGSGETIYVPEKRQTWLYKAWKGSIDFLKDIMYLISAFTTLYLLSKQ